MHGPWIERGWIITAGGILGHAMLCQCGERAGRNGIVFDGGCSEGDLVLRIHGMRTPPSLPPTKPPSVHNHRIHRNEILIKH